MDDENQRESRRSQPKSRDSVKKGVRSLLPNVIQRTVEGVAVLRQREVERGMPRNRHAGVRWGGTSDYPVLLINRPKSIDCSRRGGPQE